MLYSFVAMEAGTVYLIFLVVLFLLAISDLIVGVSNDAVNFLNSAIGSQVASRRVIMGVAAAGIAIGATFSSGMMEVARKGIFNPGMFMFDEIMIVFVAVMLTDILLLDFFNTFGLPTSTTVSIVFELLGAATAVAAYKIVTTGESWASLPDYINQDQALFIISGIFVSVFVAFIVGMLVQYLTRMMFTFDYDARLRKYGGVFGGIAITLITDFILLKGAKGTSFLNAETIAYLEENTLMISGIGLVVWTIICQLLVTVWRVNILKFIVLIGTFALAMAFAGNDLVNFIGVPIAGLISYQNWVASGSAPEAFSMAFLSESVRTETYLLVIAGAVMTLTLIFSRKARSVTATQVDLGRQGMGSERFKPSLLSRAIVGGSLFLGSAGRMLIPTSIYDSIEKRFKMLDVEDKIQQNKPAFDLVRASVNLMVAAVLIAFATSLQLPLSTTYVSFMVAMGASLSDRAWNRDSAVYRVAGVVNVIGGWFFTAIIAFSASALMAILLANTGIWGLLGLVVVVVAIIIRSSMLHRKLEASRSKELERVLDKQDILLDELKEETSMYVDNTLQMLSSLVNGLYESLRTEKLGSLKADKKELQKLRLQIEEVQSSLYVRIQKIEASDDIGVEYLGLLNSLQNILQGADLMVALVRTHIKNYHLSLDEVHLNAIHSVISLFKAYIKDSSQVVNQSTSNPLPVLFTAEINQVLKEEVSRVKGKNSNFRNSMLITSLLMELKEVGHNTHEMLARYRMLK